MFFGRPRESMKTFISLQNALANSAWWRPEKNRCASRFQPRLDNYGHRLIRGRDSRRSEMLGTYGSFDARSVSREEGSWLCEASLIVADIFLNHTRSMRFPVLPSRRDLEFSGGFSVRRHGDKVRNASSEETQQADLSGLVLSNFPFPIDGDATEYRRDDRGGRRLRHQQGERSLDTLGKLPYDLLRANQQAARKTAI